jgi:hypothetical protein
MTALWIASAGCPAHIRPSLSAGQEEDPFILPASTAPALLQTNSRPKRARGPTLDYKAMHEGKQDKPRRGKKAGQ